MCTAITYYNGNHYFGRNLDYEHVFGEQVIITPRNYPIEFKKINTLHHHYAIIGMGILADNYPLYFDATNEHGLSIAGLNFPDNAMYFDTCNKRIPIAPYELPVWILGQFRTVKHCLSQLRQICLVNIPFSNAYPLSPLHWLVADQQDCIVIESTASGLHIYDNPFGVLTNNPPFEYHLHNIANYLKVSAQEPANSFAPSVNINVYSRGMGGIGLPGDNSSSSRFIRAAFNKLNSVAETNEAASITQFFHILHAVYQVNGCTAVDNQFEKTIYSSCCNMDKGIYYYTTYENSQISAVNLHRFDLSANKIYNIPLNRTLQIASAL